MKVKVFENYKIYINRELKYFREGEQDIEDNLAKILIDKKAAKEVNLVNSIAEKIKGDKKDEEEKEKAEKIKGDKKDEEEKEKKDKKLKL